METHGTATKDFTFKMKKILVLLSGGMDSATLLSIAVQKADRNVRALVFDYGQLHFKEIESAKKLCSYYGVGLEIIKLDFSTFKSALLGTGIIPNNVTTEIPNTYVPFRNVIFLSIAAGFTESVEYNTIYYGANSIDYSGYKDCRPEFVDSMKRCVWTINSSITIEAPLLHDTKDNIIKKGIELGTPYELTWSCYRGNEKSCGNCASCKLRLKGFEKLGINDPIEYE